MIALGDTLFHNGNKIVLDKCWVVGEDKSIGNDRYKASVVLLEIQRGISFREGKQCIIKNIRGIPLVGWLLYKFLGWNNGN